MNDLSPRTAPEDHGPDHQADRQAPVCWRLRVAMGDQPGTLARVAVRLADLGCNVLGLTVLPVPGGVVDEIVVRSPGTLTRAQLADAVRAEGCECVGIVGADVHELVDVAAAALTGTTRAISNADELARAVGDLLTADVVTVVPTAEANPGRDEVGHRVVFDVGGEQSLVVRRHWAPFVELELTRAQALLRLVATVRADPAGPQVHNCADGAALVLRIGRPADADAVLALHNRCSRSTLFHRYRTGTGTIPRRWLHRLLLPPRGLSLLAVAGRDVVGLGQLIPDADGAQAEVSLLVEDDWQHNGIGTALLARLATVAGSLGCDDLFAQGLPEHDHVRRAAVKAGLTVYPAGEDGVLRIRAVPLPDSRPQRDRNQSFVLASRSAARRRSLSSRSR
jgi:GNAT superfamily N-acetyltransferase